MSTRQTSSRGPSRPTTRAHGSLLAAGAGILVLALGACVPDAGGPEPTGDETSRASPVLLHCPPGEAPSCTTVRGRQVCTCEPIFPEPPVCLHGPSAAPTLSGGYYHTCALAGGEVRCWGLLPGSGVEATTATTIAPDAIAIGGGGVHDCIVTAGGGVSCWGWNAYGQLGDGTFISRITPTPVAGIHDAVQVVAGYGNSCALRAGGRVSCWGANGDGQLGNGTTIGSPVPVDVVGLAPATAIGLSSNFDAGTFACALLTDGTVRCWGGNSVGQLGNGTFSTISTLPTTVSSLANVVGLSVGFYSACAVDCFGQVRCWGYNGYGELGDGTSTNRSTPTLVSIGADAVAVTSGDASCALRSDGKVSCWGPNAQGQLGTGDTTPWPTPHLVAGISNVVMVNAQNYRTCARTSDGAVYCWGSLDSLGDGTVTARLTPTRVIGVP